MLQKTFCSETFLLCQILMILSKNTHIPVPSKLQMKRKKSRISSVKTHLFIPGEIYEIEKIFSAIHNVKNLTTSSFRNHLHNFPSFYPGTLMSVTQNLLGLLIFNCVLNPCKLDMEFQEKSREFFILLN